MNPTTQHELNEQHWRDEANWSGPAWMALYFSKHDTRLWVPKRIPGLGWTINLGHPKGPGVMLGIFGGSVTLLIAIIAYFIVACVLS